MRRMRHSSRSFLFTALLAAIALPCHAGLPPAVYNLGSIGGSTGATISGPGLAAHAGTTLVGNCDFNGDGIPDFAVGAPPAGAAGGGAVYIVYGTANGAPPPSASTMPMSRSSARATATRSARRSPAATSMATASTIS